jgi:tetratricopeptide (TPR) repeat protein
MVLLMVSFVFSQSVPSATPGNTYAVITGIAHYENKNIPNLNFSNRDAMMFAEFLRSGAGGAVPNENIRLLIDSAATTAAMYNALRWLKEKCERDFEEQSNRETTVYFYFSGHGDLENETLNQLGYLLAYNTPSNNYINNALRLEDLNDYAHLLSVKFKAKVILITDACHSGKLAGSNFRGSYLVGKELSTARENEIRIASCLPEEVSNEHEGWGGGRGVFSYYLLHGLKGMADFNKDNFVTLDEIKKYLDQSISADPIIKQNNLKQNPVVRGRENSRLAAVSKEELDALQISLAAPPIQQSNQDHFFSLLKMGDNPEKLDFNQLKQLPKKEIPFALISALSNILPGNIQIWDQFFFNKEFVPNPDIQRLVQFAADLKEDPQELELFNEMLVEALHSIGQRVINLYLQGDEAELEKRRYYNSAGSGYEQYPAMYQLAMKLTDVENPLYKILNVNHYYFTAVALRLKIPMVKEKQQKPLTDQAIVAIKKALAMEKDAAYIHNELGILYKAKKDYKAALKYFLKATEISPVWALPWANLCGLYAETNKPEDALNACQMAEGLQPDLQLTVANLGALQEKKGNRLYAEEFYRKAIDINSRHYFPFERLGFVYLQTTKYALADSFFYEASLRKKGYHFNGNQWVLLPESMVAAATVPLHCDLDTARLKKDDVMAFFYWGWELYDRSEYADAERIFRRLVAIDKTNPLVFHYLGKVFYDQQKWEEAELMFKYAVSYYLDEEAFSAYCDSIAIKAKSYPYDHTCFEEVFKAKYYRQVENYSFLASLYEKWDHVEEAEIYFKEIMVREPQDISAYIRLWQMLEKLGRFTEAESIIKSYSAIDEELVYRELNFFYRRAILQFPETGDWYYRLGMLLYDKADREARASFLDTIVYFPLLNKEVFIDLELYDKLYMDPSLVIDGKKLLNEETGIELPGVHEQPVSVALPGLPGEMTALAEPVYTPRKDAITYLLKSAEYIKEPDALADIYFKTGNVFTRSGSPRQAYPHYAKSVELMPGNASARMKLVHVCHVLYKNTEALEHLSYLYDSSRINFPGRMMLAEFSIHAGLYVKGKKLLDEARGIHPYVLPEIADLSGRMNLMQNKTAQAITIYKNYLLLRPNDPGACYTVAILNAKSGNKSEAWKWLEKSLASGFNYSFVLDADPAWNTFRNTQQWNKLTGKYPMKAYGPNRGSSNKLMD